MQSIGFIGDQNDIQQRYHILKKLYGKAGVSILKSTIDVDKPNGFQTVEELVQNSDLIFYGHNATQNKPLMYHTIKKANYVFLDVQSPLSKSTFNKCIAYQEEAGCKVTFNINPYLMLQSKIEGNTNDNNQIYIRLVSAQIDPKAEIYKYLLFAYLYLNCSNTRSNFNIIKSYEEIRAINVSLTNLKGQQVNILIGKYPKKINKLQLIDHQQLRESIIPLNKFFNDPKILKAQLDSLYINKQLADLTEGVAVAELMQKLEEKSFQ